MNSISFAKDLGKMEQEDLVSYVGVLLGMLTAQYMNEGFRAGILHQLGEANREVERRKFKIAN